MTLGHRSGRNTVSEREHGFSEKKNSPDCQDRGGEEVKLQKWIFRGEGKGLGSFWSTSSKSQGGFMTFRCRGALCIIFWQNYVTGEAASI